MLKKRLEQNPCYIGLHSYCCKNCLMGPCIITKQNKEGVCGANLNLITSRNILRFTAGGASAHCGHAYHLLNFLNQDYPNNYIQKKAPKYLYKLWDKLGIVPKIKFEHFKEISEALHTSTMGVNAKYEEIMKWAMKLGIVDGYYGLYLATELEDKRYGKVKPKEGVLDLGVIDNKKINIAVLHRRRRASHPSRGCPASVAEQTDRLPGRAVLDAVPESRGLGRNPGRGE